MNGSGLQKRRNFASNVLEAVIQQRTVLDEVNAELMVAKGTTTSSCTTKRSPKVTSLMPRQKEQISQATPNRFVV